MLKLAGAANANRPVRGLCIMEFAGAGNANPQAREFDLQKSIPGA